MGAAQIKEELHQFINRADERILNLIYGMMKADEEDYTITDSHEHILDERLEAHKNTPKDGSSWSEVKSRIKNKDLLNDHVSAIAL